MNFYTKGKIENPALVFIHGFLLDADVWEGMTELLADTHYCICMNLPRQTSAYTPPIEEYVVQAINRYMQSHRIERFGLIGHSLGGYFALAYAEQFHHQLTSLILLNSTCFNDSPERKEKRKQMLAHVKNYGKASLVVQIIPSWFGKTYKQKNPQPVLDIIRRADDIDDAMLAEYQTYMMQRQDRSHVIQNKSYTNIIVVGEDDPLMVENDFSNLTNVRVELVEGIGHMGMLEAPQQVADIILQTN